MKATGIVRRIDNLGRVVIPKEIRRTLHIGSGAQMEIFTDDGGEVVFRKYSPMAELGPVAGRYAALVAKGAGAPCAVCDAERIVGCSAALRRELPQEAAVGEALLRLLEERRPLFPDEPVCLPASRVRVRSLCPIVANSELLGGLLLFSGEGLQPSFGRETELALLALASQFIADLFED